jgi:energy-coupling factor transporter ATP-binding protein EcfA2/uncharacterized membrane protein
VQENHDFLQVENLTFTYPEQANPVLQNIQLHITQGEFVVLLGPSGCGKTTLLRQFKPALQPYGKKEGRILLDGQEINQLSFRQQSEKIGFVQQNPENQIVTDKVWHELAFGLESLGYDTPTIRRRVAEMASFFGIQTWFYKNVTELSGGQKQLLNLASIMAMQPQLLILDEPTSQLDPIAAGDFLETLGKINRELGTTILLTEHRLEEAFPLASRAVVMGAGEIFCTGTPAEVGKKLRDAEHHSFLSMPAAMRIWAETDSTAECPVTVGQGRQWLADYFKDHPMQELAPERKQPKKSKVVLQAEDIWFRYEPEMPNVVKGFSFQLRQGEWVALLGGNGAGKSTSLKLLSGLLQPYRGQVHHQGKIGVLPQNPQALFLKKTVRQDLLEILSQASILPQKAEDKVAYVVSICQLESLLDRHPYDLSGGEQQRAALAKILLLDPDILLLDEPTKGLDAEFKKTLAQILQTLLNQGKSILMVSHDVEFCACYADRCALFFDGNLVTQGTPREFFSGNHFYTTSANRIAREWEQAAVTVEDVIAICGGKIPEKQSLPEGKPCLLEPTESSPDWKPTKLPLWRKILAACSAAVAILMFLQTVTQTDFTSILGQEGLQMLSDHQWLQYGAFIVPLFVLAGALGRRSRPPIFTQTAREKRRLSKRTKIAAGLILLLIPLTLFIGSFYLGDRKYYFISLLILLETMIPFFLVFEGRKPQARELVILAVLCGLAVAGRAAFFMFPQFKPVLALVVISGVAFGGEAGFLVGSITMLVSNILFAQGPWTPWQMFAMGIIGFLSGVLFQKGWLCRTRGSLCTFGALAAILIYGGIMNPASALIWAQELQPKIILAYYITGFPMDCIQAAATVIFLMFGAEPMLEKLDRIKLKYGLLENTLGQEKEQNL